MIKSSLHFLIHLKSLWRLPVSRQTRLSLVLDLIRMHLPGGGNERGTGSVAGHQVYYCNRGLFRFLFHEIFLGYAYYFSTSKSAPVIIDCGSNIGVSVLFFKVLHPEARITAFEPQPEAAACLAKTIETNQFQNVKLVRAALTIEPGSIPFFTGENQLGSLRASLDTDRGAGKKIIVEGVRLSDYINEPVDLLKLDVEGSEFDVLTDLATSSKISLVREMLIEYHHHIQPESDQLARFLALLEQSGFGYQIEGRLGRPFRSRVFQDLVIYAYAKSVA